MEKWLKELYLRLKNMLIKATQKNTRQTPRKVRLVANTVKNLELTEAIKQLSVIERRATLVILKTLRQAIANAMNNHGFAYEDLKLENILVTEGPRYKRFQAVSRGRAHSILKRTSHVTVILRAGENQVKTAEKSKESEIKAEEVKTEVKTEKKVVKKAPAKKTTKTTKSKKETKKVEKK